MLLTATGLSKSFGGVVAVSNVDINIDYGEILGLVGGNGAGKTTLFNLLSGYTPLDSGKIILYQNNKEIDISKKNSYKLCRLKISRTFQNIKLFDSLTVYQNVLAAKTACRFDSPDIGDILSEFSLYKKADFYPSSLSYGEKRKLELVRAICTGAKLLFLDELVAGVSSFEAEEIARKLIALRNQLSLTIVLIEHNMDFIKYTCNRLYVLNHGKVIAQGHPFNVLSDKKVASVLLGDG